MGVRIRSYDWSSTPLGPPDAWPHSLKTLLDVMLGSNQPMFIVWGPERTLLYNDAYTDILARKHPAALGQPFLDVWSEIRSELLPIVERAYAGQPVHMDDITLIMERRGYPEEAHFSFSYTPIRNDSGVIAGFFCPCTEITRQVMAERRLAAETERQRRLFEQAPGFMMALHGPEHRFEFVNQAFVRLFGDRGFVGKTIREAFPELEGQAFYEWLDQVYVTGKRFVARRVPIRFQHSPGSAVEERFLDFIYEPVTDEGGRVTGIFCEGHDATEAHLAQAAVSASNVRYTSVLSAMSEGFVVLDEDFRITEINAEGLRLDGRPESEILGKTHWEAFPASNGTSVEAAYRRAMTERVPVELEHRYVDANAGYDIWLALRIYPVPGGVAAFYRDISKVRHAEEALRRSEERLRSAFAISTVGVMFWGEGFGLTEVNDAFLRMTGFSREEALGKTWQELTPAEFLEPSLRAVHEVTTRGETTPYEKQYFRKDGTRWWGLFAARRLGNEIVEFVLDITDRKQTEAALRESEARFRHMADSAPALIWMSDETGKIIFANMHYDFLFGRPAAEMTGEGWREVVLPDDLPDFERGFFEAFAARQPYQAEVRVRDKDGDIRWLRCEGVPRFDDAQRFLGYTGCNVDITEAKVAEERRDLLINELNHRVKNTLATVQSIASQTLRNANTAAEAKESIEGRLFALSRAHDVLTRENWEGADIYEIVEQAVAPYSSRGQDRLHVKGPKVRLSPRMALSLAMMMQELATNAVKYGALSTSSGVVQVAWNVDQSDHACLYLRWEESGGPPVQAPARRGFGTRLIERSLAQDLGDVKITFAPAGVVCTVNARLE